MSIAVKNVKHAKIIAKSHVNLEQKNVSMIAKIGVKEILNVDHAKALVKADVKANVKIHVKIIAKIQRKLMLLLQCLLH